MNSINLRGMLKDIEHSHDIDNISFSKAKLLCKRPSGQEDVINLRFKSFSNKYKENDFIEIAGNVRSYSYKVDSDKNKVVIYVFTYFDSPESDLDTDNSVVIDGRICKMNPLRTTKTHKDNVHFILANNLCPSEGTRRLNSYIPCLAWGKLAKELSEIPVSTTISVKGELHSREHKKIHSNGEIEFRVAHELLVTGYEVLE